ncbi:MAG: double-strand break repair helicase AddA, partial [Alphaproteobacteria bacterium]|nr:double-strand break repair helicase AddA [Alphaproteobacteria bacterium]
MTDMTTVEQQKKERSALAQRQQQSASDPKHSVWVEASAGTGKTKVLSDRVFRLLLKGVEASKILCLTYTKAAAVEMKSRIYDKLSKWVALDDAQLLKELYELDDTCNFASDEMLSKARTLFAATLDAPMPIKIETIHAFCEEILKKFPLEAGISPYFEVMDERATSEALDGIIHRILSKMDDFDLPTIKESVLFLISHVSEFNFGQLLASLAVQRNHLMQIFAEFDTQEAFLAHLRQKLDLKPSDTAESVTTDFAAAIDRPLLKQCVEAMMHGTPTDQHCAEILEQNLITFDIGSYETVFLTQTGTIKSRLVTKKVKTQFEAIDNVLLMEAERLLDFKEKLKSIKIFESSRAMSMIARYLIDEYQLYKRQNAKLDYEDLIILTKNLFEKSDMAAWVLYKLDGGLEHVLIDEAQDTSPDQWAIIKALTDEFFATKESQKHRTVFAVGDRKQSIYGFQGARPEKFDEMSRFYQQKIDNFCKVRLDVSFRSTAAVLNTVNSLFAGEDAQKGVASQDAKVDHLPYRIGEGGLVEIWPVSENEKDDEPDIWYPPVERRVKTSGMQKLALKLALKIKEMVEKGEILASKGRPLQYGDFLVLVQRRNAFMEEFVRVAKKNNVAVCGVDRMKLGEELVIEDLISLSKFLLLPYDDLSLAEVLKSPLYNLRDDDLFSLCYNRGEMSLWQRLHTMKKYEPVVLSLTDLLNAADTKRPFELFSSVLIEQGGYQKIVARLGDEVKDALDEFMNLTLAFESEHVPNLQNFIRWIEASQTEVKRELDQNNTNAVRIMTVHGSKGLQAPVVILADTIREVKTSRATGLIFDEDAAYFALSTQDYTGACEQAHQESVDKAYDEYRRLLYVAMTRAEDRLYIAGYGTPKKEDQSWYHLLEKTLLKTGTKEESGVFV